MKYLHKKTGTVYNVLSFKIINKTNENDGMIMALYDKDGTIYVRELEEFNEKFEPCDY